MLFFQMFLLGHCLKKPGRVLKNLSVEVSLERIMVKDQFCRMPQIADLPVVPHAGDPEMMS
ncbi:MAG: hypothetical protein CW742_10715 [Methanoregula sp.]|nr:MAG: hypothetical protein CW742_10715 [Methanoregula sp.]